MLEFLDTLDKKIFLYINRHHSETSDVMWQTITNIPTWIPLYIFILLMMIVVFKKDSLYLIMGILLVILISDQFTSSFMKPFFERLQAMPRFRNWPTGSRGEKMWRSVWLCFRAFCQFIWHCHVHLVDISQLLEGCLVDVCLGSFRSI
jgi:hypothetical protein